MTRGKQRLIRSSSPLNPKPYYANPALDVRGRKQTLHFYIYATHDIAAAAAESGVPALRAWVGRCKRDPGLKVQP